MIVRIIFAIVLLFVGSSSFAAGSPPRDSFERINSCVKKDDVVGCKDMFTASSMPLYERFMSYGLMDCLPKDATYYSGEDREGGKLIRARVTDKISGKERYMRLLFVEEEGQWKLNVPQSLEIAMGKNWEKQVNMVEQVYLLMKKQIGADLNCSMILGMVRAKK